MRPDDIDDTTRRSILKAVGGALATGAAGVAAGHPGEGGGSPNTSPNHNHDKGDQHETLGDISQVGYHSLGGPGRDDAENPHYGGLTELRVQNGLAFVSFLSSRGPTPNRGFAILDVSDYTEARSEAELAGAQIEWLSYARDDNDASAAMDIKVTDDANYAVVSREPVSALFDDANTNKEAGGSGSSAGANSLQLWDVSDPSEPVMVSENHAWGLGPHNSYIHNINGDDYVFSVGVTASSQIGLYISRINRTTNQLELVNKWDKSGNVRQGGGLTDAGDGHDVTVVDDPKNGKPYVYFGMWSSPGMQVLDASDPTNLEKVGLFEMDRAHYVQPVPGLIDGKRLAIAGHETPGQTDEKGQDDPSGFLYLVDCDPIDEEDGNSTLKALDAWTWLENESFQNYYLGPHNADVTSEGWIHLAQYHGGTMFFEITDDAMVAKPGSESADTGTKADEKTLYIEEVKEFVEVADDRPLGLDPAGSFKSNEPVPMNSRLQALKTVNPFAWSAVEANGLSFISDVNSGFYIAHQHDQEVGSDVPVEFLATRDEYSTVMTAGDTNTITVDVSAEVPGQVEGVDHSEHGHDDHGGDEGQDDGPVELLVRDRIPPAFDVVASGEDTDVRTLGTEDDPYRTVVEFPATNRDGRDRSGEFEYFVEAPAQTGSFTFGPLEYSTDGGETWTKSLENIEDYRVIGQSI